MGQPRLDKLSSSDFNCCSLHESPPSLEAAMDASNNDSKFINYPTAREGPQVPYKNETQVIPVFRGIPLAIGATL